MKLDPTKSAIIYDERTASVRAQEDSRRAAAAAKTARLRELRLAREAAERAAEPKSKR